MNWPTSIPDMAYPSNPYNAAFYMNIEAHNNTMTRFPDVNRFSATSLSDKTLAQQRKSDQDFIVNFLHSKKGEKLAEHKLSPLKIFEAKKYLLELKIMTSQLRAESENLDVNSDEFDAKWEEIVMKQEKINDFMSKFDVESLNCLKVAVRKRIRKRLWLKKMKFKHKSMIEERNESIRQKHILIDKILGEKSKEVESIKRKEAFNRQADLVLHEVRKKKYEAKKILNMLAALLKLRELRSQQEVAQGGYCSAQVTETFNGVINHFQELWKKQSEMYNLEEKGLKVMLHGSEIPQLKMSGFQKNLNQWEQALFGIPSSDYHCKLLTQADNDVNSLICVRGEWDQYINNFSPVLSSCMPLGWILPPETENDEWKSFIRKKKRMI